MKCEELQRETKLHAAKVCVITAELLMSLTGRRNSTAGLTHTSASAVWFVPQAIGDAVHSVVPFGVKHDTQCSYNKRATVARSLVEDKWFGRPGQQSSRGGKMRVINKNDFPAPNTFELLKPNIRKFSN